MSGALPWLPRRLRDTPTIALVAPSGCVLGAAEIERAHHRLEVFGFRVLRDPALLGRWKYFSAPDRERADTLQQFALDPEVDVVMAARGGYGMSRILGLLDFERIGAARKAFIGFSDFTAFHLAALARAHLVTLAGPMAAVDVGAEATSSFAIGRLRRALAGEPIALDCRSSRPAPGTGHCKGMLWGGNLSLVAHLVGTPYLPEVEGGILFLEEVNEQPYQIERMLVQLELAGVLARQKAILLGAFTGCEPTARSRVPYTLPEAIESIAERFAGPILDGLPFGHVHDKATLPVGAPADLSWRGSHWELRVESVFAD